MAQEFSFESKSEPGKRYITTLHDDGSVTCDMRPGNECRGFLYSKSVPKSCTHTKQVLAGKTGTFDSTKADAPPSPMLAYGMPEDKNVDDYPEADWTLEQKYDGHRTLIIVDQGLGVRAWSRLGNSQADLLRKALLQELQFLPSGTYDGEIIVPGGVSTDVKALENRSKLQVVLFDILRVENASCMEQPGTYRRELLSVAMKHVEDGSLVRISQQLPPSVESLTKIWAAGGEGAVLKRRNTLYKPGRRSKDWIKVVRSGSSILKITDWLPGEYGPYSRAALLYADGTTTSVKTLNDWWRAELAKNGPSYIGRELVISYRERTRDGSFKHPMWDHLL